MAKKQSGKASMQEAPHVFRQFAWNLAGTLARKPPRRKAGKRANA